MNGAAVMVQPAWFWFRRPHPLDLRPGVSVRRRPRRSLVFLRGLGLAAPAAMGGPGLGLPPITTPLGMMPMPVMYPGGSAGGPLVGPLPGTGVPSPPLALGGAPVPLPAPSSTAPPCTFSISTTTENQPSCWASTFAGVPLWGWAIGAGALIFLFPRFSGGAGRGRR